MRALFDALALTAVLSLSVVTASAQSAPSAPMSPQIQYAVLPECPDRAEFLRKVASRTPRGMASVYDQTAPVLSVEVVRQGDTLVGRLEIEHASPRPLSRAFTGKDCNELVDALALVTALTLDADADADADARRADSLTAPPPAVRSPALAPSRDSPTVAVRPIESHPSDARESKTPSSWKFGAGVGGIVVDGASPEVMVGGGVIVEAMRDGESAWVPSLTIEANLAVSPAITEPGGTANFTLISLRSTLCPIGRRFGRGVALRACASADIGSFRAAGSSTVSPASSTRGWASVGALGRVDVSLGRGIAVEGALGAEAPLRRDSYEFVPTEFFTVPKVVGIAALHLVTYHR